MSIRVKNAQIEAYILQHFPMTNRQFSQELGVTIDVIKYHIKKLGLAGKRKRGAKRLYDKLVKENYPMNSASIVADTIGITRNAVNIIARRIGVAHNSNYRKRPNPIKENLVGNKYGLLTVVEQLGTNKWGQMVYCCLCQCGKTTNTTAGNLKHGNTTSCGCKRKRKCNNVSKS